MSIVVGQSRNNLAHYFQVFKKSTVININEINSDQNIGSPVVRRELRSCGYSYISFEMGVITHGMVLQEHTTSE